MAKTFKVLNDDLCAWIAKQKMFFVSTAPLSSDGLVNCSPKGLDCFRILDEHTVAYLDLTGSGAETIAHLRENGRITVMFCAFEGAARILRLYGKGKVFTHGMDGFEKLLTKFPQLPGTRSVIQIKVERIADSCGYAVPKYEYIEQRETLPKWAKKKGISGIAAYQREENLISLDGLPSLTEEDLNNED